MATTTAVAHRIQPGVYFETDDQPVCFGLLLIDVDLDTAPAEAGAAIAELWRMVAELRDEGTVRDLRGERSGDPDVRVERHGLTTLLGFGAQLWLGNRPPIVSADLRPDKLTMLGNSPFPKLPWGDGDERRPGEADLALQVIADREITINRVVVEVAKLLHDGPLPLKTVAYHRGFRRDDGRSWIDFGDGTNNMSPPQRKLALEVTSPSPEWMTGGTYMAFLRIAIDLEPWRALSREEQEIVVGREKLTGCPVVSVKPSEDGLLPVTLARCPPRDKKEEASFRDPPNSEDRLVQASHIHRSNQSRGAPDTDANNRIYRQGYEFLEVVSHGDLSLGLNFVSFQRDIGRVRSILRTRKWQGDSNFGGPEPVGPGEPQIELMRLLAGGFYAVPPVGDPFPGASLFQPA